jgi:glycosyltransferase involved in cell wall biosynthesis
MKKDRKKIFWIGDAVATTGFARVNHSIISNLPRKYEVHHLGINYMGDPNDFKHKIYPAMLGGDVWGFGRVVNLIKEIKPDLIFILNDPWVISQYLKILEEAKINDIPIVVYFPVDAEEHDPVWYAGYESVESVCVYTEFGRRVVLQAEPGLQDKLSVIPHGIDTRIFHPLGDVFDRAGRLIKTGEIIAREALYPVSKQPSFRSDFIILNANRNQPRKRIDITIRAFAEFQKDKPDVRLYLHMGAKDVGYDIIKLANRYFFDEKLIISSTHHNMPNIPDSRLNEVYNGTSIGINTSLGEGWGLTNWEHGAARRPQIVPNHSACSELWKDSGILIKADETFMYTETHTLARVPDLYSVVEALEYAYNDWRSGGEELARMADKSYNRITSPEYSWKKISMKFHNIFREVLE